MGALLTYLWAKNALFVTKVGETLSKFAIDDWHMQVWCLTGAAVAGLVSIPFLLTFHTVSDTILHIATVERLRRTRKKQGMTAEAVRATESDAVVYVASLGKFLQ